MTNWTIQRRISFWVHTGIVIVPFTFSTVSAAFFWYSLFQSAVIAGAMVLVVDVLALLGLILYIMHIKSPFQALRRVLPFISVVPLGLELWYLLTSNGPWIAGAITVLVTAIMVAVAWQCFTTIEELFIPPIEAAREKAEQDVASIERSLIQLQVVSDAVEAFARQRYSVTVVDSEATVIPLSKTQQVKRLASERGESESTVWRRVKAGTIKLEEES